MTTLSRATGKALSKSAVTFQVIKKMVKRAVESDSNSLVKSLAKNRDKMDSQFIDLCVCYEAYRNDTMANEDLTEEEFNSSVEGKPKFQYNDVWMEETREEYYTLIDSSDNKLESIDIDKSETHDHGNISEDKSSIQKNDRLVKSLSDQLETTSQTIESSIDKIVVEVSKMEDGNENPSKVSSLQHTLNNLDNKLDSQFSLLVSQLVSIIPESEVEEKELLRKSFLIKQRGRIDQLLIQLSSKGKDTSGSSQTIAGSGEKKEQTFLKKVDCNENEDCDGDEDCNENEDFNENDDCDGDEEDEARFTKMRLWGRMK